MTTQSKRLIGVTPPGSLDSADFRAWMEREASSMGWSRLEWEEGVDRYGYPMGRLMGVQPEEKTEGFE